MAVDNGRQVRRRQVFYIPGYDPIHPRRYRELYRTESAAQAQISGYAIGIRPKIGGGAYGWHADATIAGQTVTADVEVLVWSDIVRASMSHTIPATYGQLVRTAWTYVASGALRRLMWLRKGPVIAALYPVGMLLFQLIMALLIGAAAGIAGWWAITGISLPLYGLAGLLGLDAIIATAVWWVATAVWWVATAVQLAVWSAVTVWILRWFKRKDGRFFAYYLMHDYAYAARLKGANPPAMEARMAAFGAIIASALKSDVDEVLIVGHSSGAHLAVSILADLIRDEKVSVGGPALGFLAVGQVVPMVSFLPEAHRLRADLAFLSARPELTWIDVTAPGDGCAFALCDPVAVSGVAPPHQRWPLVISAAFSQSLSPERWKELRWRFFRLHFQYLCAFDRPKDYDYFQNTAGPLSLAERYRDRAPSQSRIDVAASKYTSVAA